MQNSLRGPLGSVGSLTRELSSHGGGFSGRGGHRHGGCRKGTVSPALPGQRVLWRVTGCTRVLAEEKLGGLHHLENLQLTLPLPPAPFGTVPAPCLQTPQVWPLPTQPCLPVPTSLQPPATWAVQDNRSCACLPRIPVAGGWSPLASLLTSEFPFSARDERTALALSAHPSHRLTGQGNCWARRLLGCCRGPMLPLGN